MIYTAEVVEAKPPNLGRLKTAALCLICISGSYVAFNALGVLGNVMMAAQGTADLESSVRFGTYNAVFGAIGLFVLGGVVQARRLRSYGYSVAACLLAELHPSLKPLAPHGNPLWHLGVVSVARSRGEKSVFGWKSQFLEAISSKTVPNFPHSRTDWRSIGSRFSWRPSRMFLIWLRRSRAGFFVADRTKRRMATRNTKNDGGQRSWGKAFRGRSPLQIDEVSCQSGVTPVLDLVAATPRCASCGHLSVTNGKERSCTTPGQLLTFRCDSTRSLRNRSFPNHLGVDSCAARPEGLL